MKRAGRDMPSPQELAEGLRRLEALQASRPLKPPGREHELKRAERSERRSDDGPPKDVEQGHP